MNKQLKEQNIDFVKSVNENLSSEKLDLIVTDNPMDIVLLGRLYKCIKDPIDYGGPSLLIGSIMDNFSDAKFGSSEDAHDEELFNCTKAEMKGYFFEMKLAVMMILESSELINRIEKIK